MNLSSKLGCCSLWQQWLAAIELCFIKLNAGLVAGWSSPYLAKLNAIKYPNSELPLSDIDASWIASLPNLARPYGAIFSGVLVYVISTKLSMLLSGVAFALGWLCFFVIDSLPLIYVSRVVSGVGMGMLFSVSPLYIGEIAHPKIRGALIALTRQGFLLGTFNGFQGLSFSLFFILKLIISLV